MDRLSHQAADKLECELHSTLPLQMAMQICWQSCAKGELSDISAFSEATAVIKPPTRRHASFRLSPFSHQNGWLHTHFRKGTPCCMPINHNALTPDCTSIYIYTYICMYFDICMYRSVYIAKSAGEGNGHSLDSKGFQSGNGAIGHVIIVAVHIIIVRHRHDWVRFVWPLRCCRITGCSGQVDLS